MKKRLLVALTLMLTVLLTFAGMTMAESNVPAVSGRLTSTITWSLSNGTLSIQGNGAAPDYEYPSSADPEPPWYELRDEITHIVVDEGINSLGNYFIKSYSLCFLLFHSALASCFLPFS